MLLSALHAEVICLINAPIPSHIYWCGTVPYRTIPYWTSSSTRTDVFGGKYKNGTRNGSLPNPIISTTTKFKMSMMISNTTHHTHTRASIVSYQHNLHIEESTTVFNTCQYAVNLQSIFLRRLIKGTRQPWYSSHATNVQKCSKRVKLMYTQIDAAVLRSAVLIVPFLSGEVSQACHDSEC